MWLLLTYPAFSYWPWDLWSCRSHDATNRGVLRLFKLARVLRIMRSWYSRMIFFFGWGWGWAGCGGQWEMGVAMLGFKVEICHSIIGWLLNEGSCWEYSFFYFCHFWFQEMEMFLKWWRQTLHNLLKISNQVTSVFCWLSATLECSPISESERKISGPLKIILLYCILCIVWALRPCG